MARGCKEAGISLVGGETAQLPGLYRPGEYDLVGFAVGVAERGAIPRREKIRGGDLLVGIGSNGLHSNGFSLARKVLLEHGRLRLSARIAELGMTLGEELLRPTKIYAKLAGALFKRFAVKGLANITGGGVPENLPRVMPANARARIRRGSWTAPPIFGLIEKVGKVSRSEMDRTFNNGLGMVAIFGEREAEDAVRFMRSRGQRAWIVGEIERGERGVVFE